MLSDVSDDTIRQIVEDDKFLPLDICRPPQRERRAAEEIQYQQVQSVQIASAAAAGDLTAGAAPRFPSRSPQPPNLPFRQRQ